MTPFSNAYTIVVLGKKVWQYCFYSILVMHICIIDMLSRKKVLGTPADGMETTTSFIILFKN